MAREMGGWNTLQEPYHLVEDFENEVDKAVHEISFTLICAYKKTLMPTHLKDTLLRTHPYIYIDYIVYQTDQDKIPRF